MCFVTPSIGPRDLEEKIDARLAGKNGPSFSDPRTIEGVTKHIGRVKNTKEFLPGQLLKT